MEPQVTMTLSRYKELESAEVSLNRILEEPSQEFILHKCPVTGVWAITGNNSANKELMIAFKAAQAAHEQSLRQLREQYKPREK